MTSKSAEEMKANLNKSRKQQPIQISAGRVTVQNRGPMLQLRKNGDLSKQTIPKVLQRKAVASPRPQVGVRVFQTRTSVSPTGKQISKPQVFRPNAVPKVLQKKTGDAQKGKDQSIVQPFASRIVQATKFYPNLHPGAVEPVDQNNIFKLNSFANQYRLHKVSSHGVNVPNQQYNFVRTREGEMLLHARYRHPSIAEGKQVLYAGEIYFNNGQLEWWSNGSGHYQPYAEDAGQANLPLDQFFSYQQIIKGEHKRKKGR